MRQLDHRLHSLPISLSTTFVCKARKEPGHLPREGTRLAYHLQPGGHRTGSLSFRPSRRRSSPARRGDPALQSAISASGQTRPSRRFAFTSASPLGADVIRFAYFFRKVPQADIPSGGYLRALPIRYSAFASTGPPLSARSRRTSSRTARRISSGSAASAWPVDAPPRSKGP